jgi:predicted alpha/beta-hydrolase family hydrolase
MLLGHGAGGGITAPDLLRVAAIAKDAGMAVGLVEQPYRVAGRRPAAPAAQLDTAFVAITAAARKALARKGIRNVPLVVGGRSSGARVACRTAQRLGATGVLALAFPLQPPRRRSGHEPPSRLSELLGAAVPVLVVQGERDPFGSADAVRAAVTEALAWQATPEGGAEITVSTAGGADHALRKGIDPVIISAWLARFLP